MYIYSDGFKISHFTVSASGEE